VDNTTWKKAAALINSEMLIFNDVLRNSEGVMYVIQGALNLNTPTPTPPRKGEGLTPVRAGRPRPA